MAYKAGQKLGNYQIERLLGRGGFAEVYLGKHIYLNTQAAIKVLQRQLSDDALEKFLQEARMIAGLKHPHIVRVLEFGIEEQYPFLVMAYAPYGTLRRYYSRGKIISPTLILPHIRQIADALQYAHEHKIVHRDVKPENMLLDDNNTVLLSDFGLAVRERSTYHSIHSTDSAGTTIYMAPEQLRGKPGIASDQYALGVVMYEWLCGCLPFDGPDISVVVQHLHELPIPLREHVPTLPEEVEGIVLRALEKDPKQRFASVQELAEAFEEACKDIPVEPAPAMPHRDVAPYRDFEARVSQQESLSLELLSASSQDKIVPKDRATPEISWPVEYPSLQAPSLSASLNESMSLQDMGVHTPVLPTSSLKRAPISRRTLLAGLAGIAVIAGGAGIWQVSSKVNPNGMGTQTLSTPGGQGSSGTTPSSNSKTSATHTNGTGGTKGSSVGGNGNGKGAGTTPTTTLSTSKSHTPSTNGTPGSSSSGTPSASVTATAPQIDALTVQINNPPSQVRNRTSRSVSVTTSISNISFQFYAVYGGLGNENQPRSEVINGTTDGNGNGTVSWTPKLPPGQVGTGTYAKVHAEVTDQHGNKISSQVSYVQIVSNK